MINIVLDTNILYNNFYFKNSKLQRLIDLIQTGEVNVCLTEMNQEELINQLKKKIQKDLNDYKRVKNQLFKLLPTTEFPDLTLEEEVNKYRLALENLLIENSIQVIPFPQESDAIANISKKYFIGSKPFSETGKSSFPDAIIWQSILEFLSEFNDEEELYFVSNNHKDFSNDEKKNFHADLINDLSPSIVSRVHYFNTLDDIFEEPTILELEKRYIKTWELDFDLSEGNRKNDFTNFFLENDEILEVIRWELSNNTYEAEYFEGWGEDPHIDKVEILSAESAYQQDDKWIIDFQIKVDYDFTITTYNCGYEQDDEDWEIHDSGKGESYLTGEVEYYHDKEAFGEIWNVKVD